MVDLSAVTNKDTSSTASKAAPITADKEQTPAPELTTDIRAEKTDALRQKITGLGSIRMSKASQTPQFAPAEKESLNIQINETIEAAPEEDLSTGNSTLAFMFLSAIWITYTTSVFIQSQLEISPNVLAAAFLTLFGPPALLWYGLSQFIKSKNSAALIRKELNAILLPVNGQKSLLSNDINDLYAQASEISSMSRAAIKSMQRARQGLRSDINDFSGLSKKTEINFSRLSETLKNKTEELSDLSQEIETKTKTITENAEEGVKAWGSTTLKMLEQSTTIESALQSGTDKLLAAAAETDTQTQNIQSRLSQNITSFGASIVETTERLENINTDFAEKTEGLDDLVNKVSDETTRLAETIKDQVLGLEDTTDRTVDRITDAAETIAFHKNTMSQSMTAMEVQSETIAAAVESNVSNLKSSVDHVIQETRDLENRLEIRTDRLNETAAGINLQSQIVNAINETAQSDRAALENVSNILEENNAKITNTVESAERRITAIATSTDKVSNILEKTDSLLSELSSHHEAIENTLSSRVGELTTAGLKATETVQTISGILREETQDISTLSGRIAGQTQTITSNIHAQKEVLEDITSTSMIKVERLHDALESQGKTIETITSGAQKSIEHLAQNLTGQYETIQEWSIKTSDNINEVSTNIAKSLGHITHNAQQAQSSVASATDGLKNTADSIIPACEEAIQKTFEARGYYEEIQNTYANFIQTNLSQFKEMGSVFETQITHFKDGAADAKQSMERTEEIIRDNTISIEHFAQTAQNKMQTISAAITNQSSNLHLLTDRAVVKMENVQQELNQQSHTFAETITSASAVLSEAGQDFAAQTREVHNEADTLATSLRTIATKAREEIFFLQETADRVTEESENMAGRIIDQVDVLVTRSSDKIAQIRQIDDSLSMQSSQIAEHVNTALQASQLYRGELQDQAKLITDNTAETASQIGQAISIMTSYMDGLTNAADNASNKIDHVQDKLATETDRFLHVSTAALEASKQTSDTYARQSESLFKTSQQASGLMTDLKAQQQQTQHVSFLSASKFIIESLHSLSVDVSRMLDGQISEKSWKAFQKGDVSIFTRKLAQLDQHWSVDRAQDKFRKDTEFRTYIQRFIRQFEEMYDLAQSNDHGSLLTSTIASSDISKLYGQLCTIAGHDNKINMPTLRTA